MRKCSFSLTEVLIALAVFSMALAPLSFQGARLLSRWQYRRDLNLLKSQIQLAYDLVLHCNIPINLNLKLSPTGIICRLEMENKALEKRIPAIRSYPHLKEMWLGDTPQSQVSLPLSFSGDLIESQHLYFEGRRGQKKGHLEIKGYPHVLHLEM